MQVCCNDNSAACILSPREHLHRLCPASVTFDRVTKVYDDVTALDDFSLEVADGEFMVFVGPSGLRQDDRAADGRRPRGDHRRRDRDRRRDASTTLDPRRRDVAMVFQNYALYPHMTVFDNIAFGLRARRAPKSEIRRRVESAGQALGLADLLRAQAAPALRRPAPARRDGARDRARAAASS